MTRFRRPPFAAASRALAAAILVSAGLAGCRDAPTDPLAQLVTTETAAAVEIPEALPGLTDLALRAGVDQTVAPQLVRWESSWSDPALGESARDAAVREVAPVIADALGAGGVAAVLGALHGVEKDLGLLADVPVDLVPAVESVRSLVRESRAALADGRPDRALTAGLLASDRLRSLGPVAVARTLVARADRALMATVGADEVDVVAMGRGERMLAGARQALAEGDAERALQRAFYAVQLLDQARASRRR